MASVSVRQITDNFGLVMTKATVVAGTQPDDDCAQHGQKEKPMTTQAQSSSGRTAWFSLSLAILALIFVVACGQKNPNAQPTASASSAAAQPDPVALLKPHVEALQKYDKEIIKGVRVKVLSVSYDVQ